MSEHLEGTVLFADVSGSTRLYEAAGDRAALAAIDRCLQEMRTCTDWAGGRVLKTIGDEIMAFFAEAENAAQAAIAMQRHVAALDPVAGLRLALRIGLHHGPAVEREGDLYGDTVNLAARLAQIAIGGQIITTAPTVERLAATRACTRALSAIPIKGKSEEVSIFELLWQTEDEATVTQIALRAIQPASGASLRLHYRGHQIVLGADRSQLVIGRDRSADLVVADPKASRLHCRIERRADKFTLVDHSSNGTYLTILGEREVHLRREEFVLHGRGWIGLGQSRATTPEVVEFDCG